MAAGALVRTGPGFRRRWRSQRKTIRRFFKGKARSWGNRQSQMRGAVTKYSRVNPFPPSRNVTLNYVETFTMTAGAGTIFGSEQIMALNGMYDPNYLTGGHQPYGFDQMATMYGKYKVNAVKFQLVVTDPSADGVVLGAMVQPPDEIYTLAGKGLDEVAEKTQAVTRTINDSGSQTVIINQYCPMPKLIGITQTQFKADLDRYSALISANPTKLPFLRFAVADLNSVGSAVKVRCKMTFYATFFQRKVLNQS